MGNDFTLCIYNTRASNSLNDAKLGGGISILINIDNLICISQDLVYRKVIPIWGLWKFMGPVCVEIREHF